LRLVLAAAVLILFSGCASIKVNHAGETMKMSFKTEAEQLVFFSSSEQYRPIKAEQDGNWWQVTIKDTDNLKYFLKADGKLYLPECKLKEKDDFGGELCLYER